MLHSYTFATPIPHAFGTGQAESRKAKEKTAFLRASVAILLLIFIQACSSTPEVELPEEVASLENVVVIEAKSQSLNELEPERVSSFGESEEVIIGRLGASAVDNNNKVYIADTGRNVIHVYDEDGRHLRELGREGDGPGEFRRISSIQTDDEYVHVLDGNRMQIVRFRIEDYKFIDTVLFPSDSEISGGYMKYPESFGVLESDKYFIILGLLYIAGANLSPEIPDIEGVIFDRNKKQIIEDVEFIFPNNETIIHDGDQGTRMIAPSYKRKSAVLVSGDDKIVHGWSEHLLFKYYDLTGEYLSALYYPKEKLPLNRNDILEDYSDRDETELNMIRTDNLPENWPAYSTALIDDEERIWVALFTEDRKVVSWYILDPEGDAYGIINWPAARTIEQIKNGFIYTRETDEETGLVEIVKYRFEL